jgi:signal transduction histidine kinase
MDEETQKRIFDQFYQGDTSHSQEGNGLGLTLVKKVIDLTGAKIRVTSRTGEGAVFTVRLRAAEGA